MGQGWGLPAVAATLQGIVRFQWSVCKKPGTRHSNRHRLNELLTTLCPLHPLQDKIQAPEQIQQAPNTDLISHRPHSQSAASPTLPPPGSPTDIKTHGVSPLPTFQSPSITDRIRPHLILVFPPPSDQQPLQSETSSTFSPFHVSITPSTDIFHTYLTNYPNVPFQVKNVQIFQTVQIFQAIPQSKFQPSRSLPSL